MYQELLLTCFILAGCSHDRGEAAASTSGVQEPEPAKAPPPASTPKREEPPPLSAAHEEAVQFLLGDKEPKVKDATWTSPSVLKVGVFDDGTRRDGYAEYLCLALAEYQLPKPILVSVVDIDKLRTSGEWIELGKSICQ